MDHNFGELKALVKSGLRANPAEQKANQMKDESKTKGQLIEEVKALPHRVDQLEEAKHQPEDSAEELWWPSFYRQLSAISSRFLSLPADEVDGCFHEVLELIVGTADLDRCVLSEFSEVEGFMRIISKFSIDPSDKLSTGLEASTPWSQARLRMGKLVCFSNLDELPQAAAEDRRTYEKYGPASMLHIPVKVGGVPVCSISFETLRRNRKWGEEAIEQCSLLAEVFGNALSRKQSHENLAKAFEKIKELKDRLQEENIYLRQEIGIHFRHDDIIGESPGIRKVLSDVAQVSKARTSVLILGETGTGKGLLARAIHEMSPRKNKPMISVNCANLPATLVDAELFGREKGAYTGALTRQIGRFEAADGSTIFLDEVGDLPLEMQAKLLRVLQDGQFERLGSPEGIRVDVRLIAATNKDLAKEVREDRFRKDLYYRLNVFPLFMPPLRERREDIPLLVWALVGELSREMGKSITSIPKKTMDLLQSYSWPGNIRELRNVLERAIILSTAPTLRIDRPEPIDSVDSLPMTLQQVERRHIRQVLEMTNWKVSGKMGAAEVLGLKPTTLEARMKKLGIRRPASSHHPFSETGRLDK